jgi:hypothetical protein
MTFTNEGTWDRVITILVGFALGYAAWVGDLARNDQHRLAADWSDCARHWTRGLVSGIRGLRPLDQEEGRGVTLTQVA